MEADVRKNAFFQLKPDGDRGTPERERVPGAQSQQPKATARDPGLQRRAAGPGAAVGDPAERVRGPAAPAAAHPGPVEDWILQKTTKKENGEMKYFAGEKIIIQ